MINDWNSLPREVVTSPNVLTFKLNLDKFLHNQCFSHYIRYSHDTKQYTHVNVVGLIFESGLVK